MQFLRTLFWVVLAIVYVGTVLSGSELMPRVLRDEFFGPYRLKTFPVLLVWLLAPRHFESLLPVHGHHDSVTLALEVVAKRRAKRCVVFND